jgi:hypothetical protein
MAYPTTAILDNFTGADQNPLSGNWTNAIISTDGNMQRVSNAVSGVTGGVVNSAWWNVGTFGPDCEVYATIPNDGNIYLYARITSPNIAGVTCYQLSKTTTSNFDINKIISGSSTYLQSATQAITDGDGIGLSVIGSQITVYYRSGAGGSWVSILSFSDTSISGAGYIGLGAYDNFYTFDDFGGGTALSISAQPSTQRIVENTTATFSVTAAGGVLTYQWQLSHAGGAYGDVGGATSSSYTTGTQTYSSNNLDAYRCNISNGTATITSSGAYVSISQTASLGWTKT